jgi:outer membrane immunogenic protein
VKKILFGNIAFLALVAAAPAVAADLGTKTPVYKAPPPVVAAYNWTGCYIGGHVGGGWGKKNWLHTEDHGAPVIPAEPFGQDDVDGIIGGGQLGCNYQTGAWVLGIEGDLAWSDIRGSHVPFTGDFQESKVDWIATVTGRVGYSWDRVLLYVKGGGAWARDKFSETFNGFVNTAQQTRSGWTVGGGLEYAITGNWTAKIEYNYLDFGDKFVRVVGPVDNFGYQIDQQMHIVKAGLNYRFGGGAARAAY